MPDIDSSDTRNILQTFTNTAATIAANQAAQDAALAANQAAQDAAFAAQAADNLTQAAATLAAQTAALAAQAAADAANAGVTAVTATATEISGSMVINEVFTVPSSAFVLQGSGLYHAVMTLIKVDGTKGVQLSLTDSDGDAQGFSQLISPYLGDVQKATVELTASQFTNNDYPLSFICQGCKLIAGAPSVPPSSGTPIGGGATVQLADYILTVKNAAGTVINTLTNVYQGWFTDNVIYVQYVDGSAEATASGGFVKLLNPWTASVASNIGEWDAANQPGGVIL